MGNVSVRKSYRRCKKGCLSVFCQAEHVYTQMFTAPPVSARPSCFPSVCSVAPLSCAMNSRLVCHYRRLTMRRSFSNPHPSLASLLLSPQTVLPFAQRSLCLSISPKPSHTPSDLNPLLEAKKKKNQNLTLHCGRTLVRTQPSVFARLPANFGSKQI